MLPLSWSLANLLLVGDDLGQNTADLVSELEEVLEEVTGADGDQVTFS